jgi:uncharacterized protein YjbI with pentapeptide repeats
MGTKRLEKIARKGADAWNDWRAKNLHLPADLSQADLAGVSLGRVNFRRVNLTGANLIGARMADGIFTDAILTDAKFIGAKLPGAELQGADLRRARLTDSVLTETDFSKAQLNEARLTGADLTGAKLMGANLEAALLGGADLTGTDLTNAEFKDASLVQACLKGAHLSGTIFQGADLTSADLSGALLVGTNFSDAKLDGVNFANARLLGTIFAFTSFRSVKGLESCVHLGRSSVDYSTLIASGELPSDFLRGCGMSEKYIERLASFRDQPLEFHSCFISYSEADKMFARRLHDALQHRGIRCWFNEHELVSAGVQAESIERGLRLWDKILLCCSRTALESWWIETEIRLALEKEKQLQEEKPNASQSLIVLSLDDHLRNWDNELQPLAVKRLAADFAGWESDKTRFQSQFERVVRALQAERGERPEE